MNAGSVQSQGFGDADPIAATVAAALALQELDRLKAQELLPEPALLLGRLQSRRNDFNLLVGVTAAYLHAQAPHHG